VEWSEVAKNKMEIKKNMLVWGIIGVLFLSVLFLMYKSSTVSGNSISGDSGNLDTTGWTANEIMNYEMHGTIPTRIAGSNNAQASGGMVGGC